MSAFLGKHVQPAEHPYDDPDPDRHVKWEGQRMSAGISRFLDHVLGRFKLLILQNKDQQSSRLWADAGLHQPIIGQALAHYRMHSQTSCLAKIYLSWNVLRPSHISKLMMKQKYRWCDVMWCDAMWCDVMWCDVMWCDVMWCVAWCYIVSCLAVVIMPISES